MLIIDANSGLYRKFGTAGLWKPKRQIMTSTLAHLANIGSNGPERSCINSLPEGGVRCHGRQKTGNNARCRRKLGNVALTACALCLWEVRDDEDTLVLTINRRFFAAL